MSLDAIVVNPGRLRILTELAVEERQEFVRLRARTSLTDGNLASHARRLSDAGLVQVDKVTRDGKAVTTYTLTTDGRRALEAHVRRVLAAVSQRRVALQTPDLSELETESPVEALEPVAAGMHDPHDDWVD